MRGLNELVTTGLGTAYMLEVAAKATAILLATWVVAYALRKASAATRHAVWVVGLTAIVMVPVGSILLPDLSVPVFVAAERTGAATPLPPGHEMPTTPVMPAPMQATRDAVVTRPMGNAGMTMPTAMTGSEIGLRAVGQGVVTSKPDTNPWIKWIFLVWWAGAAVALSRLLLDRIRVGILARFATIAAPSRVVRITDRVTDALGVRRTVRVRVSDWVSVPVTWGILHPVVVLPADADTWNDERIEVVLRHEIAHIRRPSAPR